MEWTDGGGGLLYVERGGEDLERLAVYVQTALLLRGISARSGERSETLRWGSHLTVRGDEMEPPPPPPGEKLGGGEDEGAPIRPRDREIWMIKLSFLH